MRRDSFLFKTAWGVALSKLNDAMRLEVYDAIIDYVISGEAPELSCITAEMSFAFIKAEIDGNVKEEEERRRKKSEAGKLGMAKRWNSTDNTDNSVIPVMPVITKADGNIANSDPQPLSATEPTSSRESAALIRAADADAVYIDNNIYIDNKYIDTAEAARERIDTKENKGMERACEQIDFVNFVAYFNSVLDKHGSSIQRMTRLSESRKKMIVDRVTEMCDQGLDGKKMLCRMIENAAQSDFLNGRTEKGRVFGFDWLMKQDNFLKVVEGNYDNTDEKRNGSRDYATETRATSPDDYDEDF